MFSTGRLRPGIFGAVAVLWASVASAQTAPADATLFRVFLRDGSTLVSYGEFARVADEVVLSMPIGGTTASPTLQLVSIPASGVDWNRTDEYAESARAAKYASTRGPDDYAMLTVAVSNALAEITRTADPDRKVAMAVEARQNVTKWVAEHYGYRAADAANMATLFDDVINDVRTAAGEPNYRLSLIANMAAPPSVPLMAAPSTRESLQEGFTAAALVKDPSQRTSLLRAIRDSLAGQEPADWVTAMRAQVGTAIDVEERIDRRYAWLTKRTLRSADWYARTAQVTALSRLPARVLRQDDRLGHRRPEATASLLAALDAKLDAARRLRLARDQWAQHMAMIAAYRRTIAGPLASLKLSRPSVEEIRQLAGPPRLTLAQLTEALARALDRLSGVTVPVELESAHALLLSSVRLMQRAAQARVDAVTSGQMQQAWDAASAASGALMLFDRAVEEFQQQSRVPVPK